MVSSSYPDQKIYENIWDDVNFAKFPEEGILDCSVQGCVNIDIILIQILI